jgi:hypothetical protein
MNGEIRTDYCILIVNTMFRALFVARLVGHQMLGLVWLRYTHTKALICPSFWLSLRTDSKTWSSSLSTLSRKSSPSEKTEGLQLYQKLGAVRLCYQLHQLSTRCQLHLNKHMVWVCPQGMKQWTLFFLILSNLNHGNLSKLRALTGESCQNSIRYTVNPSVSSNNRML